MRRGFKTRQCLICSHTITCQAEAIWPIPGDINGICAAHNLEPKDFVLTWRLPWKDVYKFMLGKIVLTDWTYGRVNANHSAYKGLSIGPMEPLRCKLQ